MASRTAYSTWTPQKPTLFDGNYLRNRSTLDIGVLGYIGIVQHKERSPEILSIPPGTLCIQMKYDIYVFQLLCFVKDVFENRNTLRVVCYGYYSTYVNGDASY